MSQVGLSARLFPGKLREAFAQVVGEQRRSDQVLCRTLVPAFPCALERVGPFVQGVIAASEPHERHEADLLIGLEVVDRRFQLQIRGIIDLVYQFILVKLIERQILFGERRFASDLKFVSTIERSPCV